ncbi:DNA excision repair protein ERCC-5 homolog isoform X2 [Paralichthys olivaceus]|uniref:DNA excision repair protein ERCC-5 homolog isoform X2 n=1 Tax=Paralichthys olivaceus TaxID=8255 RepID=UPI0037528727
MEILNQVVINCGKRSKCIALFIIIYCTCYTGTSSLSFVFLSFLCSSEEDEDKEWEKSDSCHMYQGELHGDPNSVDINSEEFANLPPEMKHEILKDMKEFSKRRRTLYHQPPERSGDFSQYQLTGLLQRNKLNQRLEGVEKEMSERAAGSAPQLCQEDGQSHSVESRRLVSEDNSHYILIKGSTKSKTATESQPAAAPWSGSSLSGCKRRAADRPEPLWRPVCEGEEEKSSPSKEDSKRSASKPPQGDTSPPSPRTLQAIQSAMNDSSDEEKVDKKDGSVSPRTQLAIQRVLAEEEDGGDEQRNVSVNLQTNIHHSVPQVVINSSEEETEPLDAKCLQNEKSNSQENPTGRSPHVNDSLLVSSSEDEMEDVIAQRNRALHLAVLQKPQRKELRSEEEMKDGELTEDVMTGSGGQIEKQVELERTESEHRLITKKDVLVQPHVAAVSSQNELSINLSAQRCEKPLSETEVQPVLSEQRRNMSTEGGEESESEESFVEVSEEESKEEDEDDSLVEIQEIERPAEVQEDETKKIEPEEERSTEAPAAVLKSDEDKQDEEDELNEGKDTESSSNPAVNEWEHLDVDELEALESSLQVEQSSLREQKQQQERMANTVTGQMQLESQELLRLFGVPFLVAPMEAEAQCAALDRAEQTHGTITDDSDVWLFGGRQVYKNFFSQNKYVEHYQCSDLQNQLGLDRTKLINLAYLLGSDYTEGVPGVGYVTGMEILNEFPGPGLEPLTQFSQWWSEVQEKKRLVADPRDTKVKKKLRDLKLQPGFPNPAVAQAYLQPAVDQSDSSFSWGRPQLDVIKEFCLNRFGWSSRKTEETLQPVIKQLNMQQTQLRIDSFFRMEQHEKQTIRSQRLRRAVTCMKRKERGEGEEDSEEEMPSPIKSKRGKEASKDSKKGGEKETERAVAGGGFVGSEVTDESPHTSLKDVSSINHESISVKSVSQASKTPPRKVRSSSSSSSGDDSDGGVEVAMVTARSVFEGSARGRKAKNTRGRGRGRGKKMGGKN